LRARLLHDRYGIEAMDVDSIMTTSVVTTAPTDTVRSALQLLEDQEIRHLPVVDDGRLVGMLSDRDVREQRLPLMEELDDPERASDLLSAPISSVMQSGVLSLDTGDSLADAIDLMLEHKIGAVPVVERHTEQLVGIVSYIDVLRALRPGA
jgi:acetoin utilization protein AcuB